MLSEEDICRALHASRVVPLGVSNPHGPLGLEQLAAAVAVQRKATQTQVPPERVSRPIELPVQTWEKLHALAAASSRPGTSPITAGELAAVIIEQYVLDVAS
jgi:hypothetical protein